MFCYESQSLICIVLCCTNGSASYFHRVRSHKKYTVFQYLICIFLIPSFLLEKTLEVSIIEGYFFTLTALTDGSVFATNAISHVLFSSACLYVLKIKPRHVHATCVGLTYRQGNKVDSLLFSPQWKNWFFKLPCAHFDIMSMSSYYSVLPYEFSSHPAYPPILPSECTYETCIKDVFVL